MKTLSNKALILIATGMTLVIGFQNCQPSSETSEKTESLLVIPQMNLDATNFSVKCDGPNLVLNLQREQGITTLDLAITDFALGANLVTEVIHQTAILTETPEEFSFSINDTIYEVTGSIQRLSPENSVLTIKDAAATADTTMNCAF